jgi:hypothetical protein
MKMKIHDVYWKRRETQAKMDMYMNERGSKSDDGWTKGKNSGG